MAAAVLAPMQGLALDREIMAPSPMSPNASRHGRGKHGGSVAKGKRTRGYSVADDRETLVSKALTWVLKRTVDEDAEQEEGLEQLVADKEGWVDCEEVLQHPNLSSLQVPFSEIQSLLASPASKSRFELKQKPSATITPEEDPSAKNYLIRINPLPHPPSTPTTATTQKLTPLTITTEDLPPLIVYETSYPNYPLILASGAIKRAGGQAHLTFTSIQISDLGTEIRPHSDADVSIYIDLRAAMESNPSIKWSRTEKGDVVTEGNGEGELSKEFWKRVVARRADIGVLYEDGEVKKEVPVGLRGKGAKPKKGGKGRGLVRKEMKARSEDEGTNSD